MILALKDNCLLCGKTVVYVCGSEQEANQLNGVNAKRIEGEPHIYCNECWFNGEGENHTGLPLSIQFNNKNGGAIR